MSKGSVKYPKWQNSLPEIWKDVPGSDGLYEVSSYGIVRNKRTGRILSPCLNTGGYYRFAMYIGGKSKSVLLHRVLAMNFIPNPNGYPEINHIDSDRKNDSLDNLEWCTRKMNLHHAASKGRMNWQTNPGKGRPYYKRLSDEEKATNREESLKRRQAKLKDKQRNIKKIINTPMNVEETDTRTLPEIWKSLTDIEKENLRMALILAKTAKSRQAIHYWVTGQRKPANDLTKDRIAIVVSRVIKKKTYGKTLFPLQG